MAQGDPLAMVNYGIGFVPLIKHLKEESPGITQPWYTDDSVALFIVANVELYFNLINRFYLGCGNPKP